MPNEQRSPEPAKHRPGGSPADPGLSIRAREPADWQEISELLQLPKVLWGGVRSPFSNKDRCRKRLENPPDGMTGIVAILDGRIVGCADVTRYRERRSHVGRIGISVHDDFHGRRIGSAMMATLIEIADNWLDLRRLELKVHVDNEPAIRLYRKFGFEVEGTHRADCFRSGAYIDSHTMARIGVNARARQ